MAKVSKTVGLKWKFKVFYRTVGNYMFKVNKRNTKNKLRHRHRSRVFIVNFKYFSQLVLVVLLLTLSR